MTAAVSSPAETEVIDLVDSLRGEWIKLPLAAMRDVGPAAQTLGGLLAITNRETFVATAKIADRARLPVATIRKHLATLHARGWIEHKGRGRTRSGVLRRTVTYQVTNKSRDAAAEYGALPWWACCSIRRFGRFTWSAKAVLAVVIGRLMSMAAAIEVQDGRGVDAADFWGALANMGDDDHFRFSLDRLTSATGLSVHSVVRAKGELKRADIVDWWERKRPDGGDDRDVLMPREEFRVLVSPASEARCSIEFDRGEGD